MSVIAAKVYDDKIVIAADSIIIHGWFSKTTNHDFVKLERINDMVVGGVGDADEMSLMWLYMRTHKPIDGQEKSILEFMIEFAKWKRDYTTDSTVTNTYLLAYQKQLFFIYKTFVHAVSQYKAIGAGEDFATTALYLGHTPREAVKAACDLCCLVAEPILEEIIHKNE